MNMIAIDIGNTNIAVGLYVDDQEQYVRTVPGAAEDARRRIGDLLVEGWNRFPLVAGSKEHKRDGLIVASSVKDAWMEMVREVCREKLGEKIKVIGRDVPLPIEMGVEDAAAVGTDRVVNAAAAFAVIEDACVVASFGTAVTIDLVDEQGVFLGGVIAPGFEMGASALHAGTAQLPKVTVAAPRDPVGGNTTEAINAGLFYSAVGLLRTMTEMYAEQLGKWPHTIVTGGGAGLLKGHCDFVDSWVDNLTVRGVVLAYKKHLADRAQMEEAGMREGGRAIGGEDEDSGTDEEMDTNMDDSR